MDLTRLLRLMTEERKQMQKVIDILKIGGRSKKTIDNYVCAINRFFKYFESKDISKLNELASFFAQIQALLNMN